MTSAEPPTTNEHPTSVPTVEFAEMARALFSARSVNETLGQVVSLAVATIEGCDLAGIFLVDGDVVTTPVRTEAVVEEVDALQHLTAEGPCLEAIREGVTFYADDLADDPRWPRFGPEAIKRGVRSLLALPLFVNGTLGALNLYARYPRAFGVVDRARGLLLAALAALAYSAAKTHEDQDLLTANLYGALATREVIGQAQGILMERERITADQAFDVLRRASQHLNRKLREVAADLVDTGEWPEPGSSPSLP
jgi:GAF domain-containing protein